MEQSIRQDRGRMGLAQVYADAAWAGRAEV